MNEQEQRYALAAGVVMAIDRALKLATPAEILDENSPIMDGIRQFMTMIEEPPNVQHEGAPEAPLMDVMRLYMPSFEAPPNVPQVGAPVAPPLDARVGRRGKL